jgi:murein hydrolase activator
MRTLSAFVLAAGVAAARPVNLDALREAAARTRAQIAERLDEHDRGLRARVRTLYKLSAFGDLPNWVDPAARADALRRRGAARRVILRDLEERRLLRAELDAVDGDLTRIARDEARAQEMAAAPVPEGSLVRPVPGDVVASFGPYTDEHTHVRLLRRGVELGVHTPEVVAAASGQVLFAAAARGMGVIVIIDHGQGVVSITGGLASTPLARGDLVAAAEPIGRAAGPRITFEVRRGGRPVDPFPLLRARR